MQNQRSSDLLNAFIRDCQYRNLAKRVVEGYQWYLNDIEKRCGDLMQVNRQMIKHLVTERLKEGLSPYTVNHYVKAIKVFYSFLMREELASDNPMAKLTKVIEPKNLKPVLDENKIARLIAVVPKKGFYHTRDRAMITLIWDTAVRLMEVLTIEMPNIDLQFRTIKIRGKGNKDRMVPFGNRAKKEISRYLKYRGDINSHLLFCTRDGLQISTRNFQRTIRTYGNKIGVKVSPHLIRHSAASFLAKNEMPAQHIQILLGHSNLNTTQRYINQIVNQEGLQISHRRLSPGDRI
jgi:integrase/recombinase XerD